jgi:lipoyl(octanoyl) transferase
VDGKIGVWLHGGEKKIASIGIAIKHWVSYHGMAFNFNTPSEVWQHINPCGFNPTVMTDLKKETGLENLTYEQLKQKFTHTLSS